jgi:hypothetical protein
MRNLPEDGYSEGNNQIMAEKKSTRGIFSYRNQHMNPDSESKIKMHKKILRTVTILGSVISNDLHPPM